MAKLKFGSPAWQRKFNPRFGGGRKRAGRRVGARSRVGAGRSANATLVRALGELGAMPSPKARRSKNGGGGMPVLRAAVEDQFVAVTPSTEGAVAMGGAITRVQQMQGGRAAMFGGAWLRRKLS